MPKPAATDPVLEKGLNYTCSIADCGPMQLYGSCFYPNTLIHYTYFAMNAYYHASGSLKFDCNFNSSRFIALTDPGN